MQRQIHEMGRSVLSELKVRNGVSLPEAFHVRPEPLGHVCTMVYNKNGTCANFGEICDLLCRFKFCQVNFPLQPSSASTSTPCFCSPSPSAF